MRLLTDSSEADGNTNSENSTNNKTKRQHHPYHRSHFHRIQHHRFPRHTGGAVKMKNYQSVDSLSSDDSSINSSPSPTDYMLDIMYGDPAQQQIFNMLQFKDLCDPMNDTNNAMGLLDPFFGSDIITPLLNEQDETTTTTDIINQPITDDLLLSSLNMIKCTRMNNNTTTSIPNRFSLWPNYLCLYLEYPLPHDPCGRVSHNLSQLPHCYANCLSKTAIDALPKDKCPPLVDLAKNIPLLHAKVRFFFFFCYFV